MGKALENCTLCPRACGADRTRGPTGFCRTDDQCHIAAICLHRGEEPAISGPHGICNVFFAHCNMQCVYCQNYQISDNRSEMPGRPMPIDTIVDRIRELLEQGATSVGFVSPSHCIPQMRQIVAALEAEGNRPTVVMNTNAYDTVPTLRTLENVVDVYLPDLKYMDRQLAGRLSHAPDYPRAAAAALKEMFRQKGARLERDSDGIARNGLIVRHLVLPGQTTNSKQCLDFIAHALSPEVYVSLMAQYRPTPRVGHRHRLSRRIRPEEYREVVRHLDKLGLQNGWTQERNSTDHYVPDFAAAQPFAVH